jgi:hypothetical protein
MDFLDILGLLSLAAVGWLWMDSLKAREIAVAAAKAACRAEQLLLLDDTVAISRISFGRDEDSVMHLRRLYGFEYSDTGDDRRTGSILMLGGRVRVIRLDRPASPPESSLLH